MLRKYHSEIFCVCFITICAYYPSEVILEFKWYVSVKFNLKVLHVQIVAHMFLSL